MDAAAIGCYIQCLFIPITPVLEAGRAEKIRLITHVYLATDLAEDYGANGGEVVAVSTLEERDVVSYRDGDVQAAVRDGERGDVAVLKGD